MSEDLRELTKYVDAAKKACGEFNDMTGKPLPETCAEMLAEIRRLRGLAAAFEKNIDVNAPCPSCECVRSGNHFPDCPSFDEDGFLR